MRLYTFVACLALLFSTQVVHAHSLGASFEATSTPHIIDVGYDPPVFEAGRNTRFDFDLWDFERLPVSYDHVWVRLVREKAVVLATGVRRQSIGPTTLLYAFGKPGLYTLEVSYRSSTAEEITDASFDLFVEPDPDIPSPYLLLASAILIGLLVGGFGLFLVRRFL